MAKIAPGGEGLLREAVAMAGLDDASLSGKFLDIGCGEGDAVAFFAEECGFSCVGVDASPQMVTQCRKLHPRSRFFVADATCLPFGDTSFDVVLFECVLSTLEDPSAALQEAVRVLAPGGKLIVADLCGRADWETPEQARAGDPRASVADAGRMPGGYFDRQGFLDCCASSGLLLLDVCDKTAALDSFAAEILLAYGSFAAWLEATVPAGEDAARYCAVCLDGEGQAPDRALSGEPSSVASRAPGYFLAVFSKVQRGKCAVVLAAGLSSRMGGAFKPLLPIEGDAALTRLLRSIRAAGIGDIGVVGGHRIQDIRDAVKAGGMQDVTVLENARYAEGMFSSVQAGLAFAAGREDVDAALLFPVDVPLVTPESVRAVLCAAAGSPASFAVACFLGKKGHPLLVPRAHFAEILACESGRGLKEVTDRHDEGGGLVRVETRDEGVVLDMDTPEGYAEILQAAQRPKDSLSSVLHDNRNRIILVRHGSIRQHEGKIFLGQTDVPLSDEGRAQARAAAEALQRQGIQPARIYTSDLVRAAETAQITAEALSPAAGSATAPAPVSLAGLRETCLGDWDGLPIDEVRVRFPEAYGQRGQHLLSWKGVPGMESFYDMRYRVLATLRSILSGDLDDSPQSSDAPIAVVAHAGVIRAILGLVRELPDEEAFALPIPYGSVHRP